MDARSLEHLESSVWPVLEGHFGLPNGLLKAIATVESRLNPRAYNAASRASGMFQLTPITLEQVAIDTGVRFDPFSPGAASMAAAALLARHLRTFGGNIKLALAAYNAGEGRIKRYLREAQQGGAAPLPRETAGYASKVLGIL